MPTAVVLAMGLLTLQLCFDACCEKYIPGNRRKERADESKRRGVPPELAEQDEAIKALTHFTQKPKWALKTWVI